MANEADRKRSGNPDLGAHVQVNIGTTAAEGIAAGERADAEFRRQMDERSNSPLPRSLGYKPVEGSTPR